MSYNFHMNASMHNEPLLPILECSGELSAALETRREPFVALGDRIAQHATPDGRIDIMAP
jgi:hypothetical protein